MFRTTSAFTSILRHSHTIRPQPLHHAQLKKFTTTQTVMGVVKKVLVAGDGINFPKPGDTVIMHYVGTLESGEVFDSSHSRGTPFKTVIGKGNVIKGWDESVPSMSVGEKAELAITSDYGYGDKGFPGKIKPNEPLNFEVELLAINPPEINPPEIKRK